MGHFYPTVNTPDDAEAIWPPGAPSWPPIFRHDDGAVSVALRHPTPFLKSLGTGIGCLVLFFVPLLLTILASVFFTSEAGGFACCFYGLAIVLGAVGLERAGTYIGSRLNGTTRVVFTDKLVTIDPGKGNTINRNRVPQVSISFRMTELPDLAYRQMGKKGKLRLDLANQRRIILVYGRETLLVTTMINIQAAEQFVAALNAAVDESATLFKNPTSSKGIKNKSRIDPRDLAQ